MISRTGLHIVLALLVAFGLHSRSSGQSRYLRHFSPYTSEGSAIPPSNNISHAAVSGGILWFGTSKGLTRSMDTGKTWTSFRSNPAFANDGIYATDAADSIVWAATGYDKDMGDGSTVQTGSGYAFSTNGGATWTHRGQALDGLHDTLIAYGINDSLRILPVVVPEQNVTFDISLQGRNVWIASWASGLRRSSDNGATWQRILLPSDIQSTLSPTDTLWTYAPSDTLHLHRIFPRYDPRTSNNYLAFSVLAEDSLTIWAGTAGGVNKSTDGGKSWQKFSHQNEANPILGDWVIAIREQDFGATHRVWTTNWKANDPDEDYGVSYTDDGGATWTTLLRGSKTYDFAFLDSITYIASDDGIYRTADGGQTFTLFSNITDPVHHQVVSRPSVYTVSVIRNFIDPLELSGVVIAGTSDGIALSADGKNYTFGQTWTVTRAYAPLGSQATSYAYPNPFSPRFEVARIHYGAGAQTQGTRSVSIEIYDFGMNRVRTLLHQADRQNSAEYDEIWDGRTDNGTQASNGVYFYRISIDNNDPLYGKILLLQ